MGMVKQWGRLINAFCVIYLHHQSPEKQLHSLPEWSNIGKWHMLNQTNVMIIQIKFYNKFWCRETCAPLDYVFVCQAQWIMTNLSIGNWGSWPPIAIITKDQQISLNSPCWIIDGPWNTSWLFKIRPTDNPWGLQWPHLEHSWSQYCLLT
jgi:hypothetical protein